MLMPLVVCLGLAGCLRIADFKPPDPTGDGGVDADPNTPPAGVTATRVGGVVVVAGSFFELKFGAGGAHFPDSLTIGSGANVLAQASSCEESGMGLQVHPAFVIDATHGSGPQPDITIDGTSVAQVRVPWTQPWTCADGSNTASGASTFTVYPEGRIVRHDDIRFEGTAMVGTTGCACNLPANNVTSFTVRSYMTLRDDAFPVTPEPSSGDGTQVQPVGASTQVCSSTATHSMLYAFENDWARLRKLAAQPNGSAYALSYDMFLVFKATTETDTTLTTTLISRDPASCGALTTKMLALRSDVEIILDDMPGTPTMLVASPIDGIYALPTPTTFVRDRLELRANGATPVPSGFVVKLKFAGPRTRVTTSLPMSSYLVSHPAPDEALIYVLAPLDETTPITINAEP